MERAMIVRAGLLACALIHFAIGQDEGPARAPIAGPPVPNAANCLAKAKLNLVVTPEKVLVGQSATITWDVIVSDACGPVTIELDKQVVQDSGTKTIAPTRSRNIILTVSQSVSGKRQTLTKTASISVAFPDRIVISSTTPDPVNTVVGALESDNGTQIVELCNVDLDFTGWSDIVLGKNRFLIASPGCERGPRRLGSRIFVTDKRNGGTALFVIRESNVQISGFRLQGPMPDIEWDDSHQEIGIEVSPFGSATLMSKVEISNMEISNWSGAAIKVNDNDDDGMKLGRLTNQNVGAVHVVNNYLHHNRHIGEGYGVEVASGAYALIERNVFEENRHAIAGISKGTETDYPGFTARDNLILPGGGLACRTEDIAGAQIILGCWQTHQIDMHGDTSTTLGGEWCCGNAGETMIIQRNTILYTGGDTPYALELGLSNGPFPVWTSGYAIKIRGNPLDKAVVDGNVFKHANRGDAISQNGDGGFGDNITNPIQVLPNNLFGIDPTQETLPVCDFAGDGQLDQFMATGVTWWAKSPVTHQWRYLNTMPERLSALQVGRFDNDAVCDVAPLSANPLRLPDKYSKGGMGPWVPLLVNAQ